MKVREQLISILLPAFQTHQASEEGEDSWDVVEKAEAVADVLLDTFPQLTTSIDQSTPAGITD